MKSTLRIASWNVLAAPWASPRWYPEGMDPTVLERAGRTQRVAAALARFDADVICLQETTPTDLAQVLATLGDYESHFATNGADLWSNWGAPDIAWEPNGTAVLVHSSRFEVVDRGAVELGPHGNVCTWLRVREQAPDDGVLHVVSLHLDSDDPERRRAELLPLFDALSSEMGAADSPVIIAGDYNEATVAPDAAATDLGAAFFDLGFVDACAALGRREPTHPYARPGDAWEALATIDHVLVRGLAPKTADIVEAGTWALEVPGDRMEALLRRTGSDHCALVVEVD